jgi:hypothetical protein
MGDYSSNLDSGDLARYPSAATPLSIDELLALRGGGDGDKAQPAIWAGGYPGAVPAESSPSPAVASPPSANTAAPTAAPIPATASPTTAQDYSMAGLAGLQRDMQDARAAENEIPTSNPKLDELNRELAAKSEPTPLRTMTPEDTKAGRTEGTGAMLAEYKPSVMSRIGRGVRSGAIGFLTGGIPGAVVGAIEPQDIRGGTAYGAPNASYGREESERQREVGDLSGQAAAAKEAWKAQVDAANAKAKQIDASGKLAGDLTTGANANVKNANDAADAAARNANETPEAKAQVKALEDTQEYNSRMERLNTLEKRIGKIPAQTEAYYIANGKLPDPKQPHEPTFEEIALAGALRTLGHKPSHDEYMQIVSQVRGKAGEGDSGGNIFADPAVTSVVEKATADVNKYKTDHRFVPTQPGPALDAYNNGIREIFAAANEKLKKTGVQFDAQGNLQDVRGNRGAGATPQGQPPARATGTAMGRDGKLHWTDGKVDLGVAI